MDAYYRNGIVQNHKGRADEACEHAHFHDFNIDKVLIWQRHPGRYTSKRPLVEGRDFIINDMLKDYHHTTIDPVSMRSEEPLFLMYTSGTTGKPKGCQHSTGGYLSYVAGTSKFIQDISYNFV